MVHIASLIRMHQGSLRDARTRANVPAAAALAHRAANLAVYEVNRKGAISPATHSAGISSGGASRRSNSLRRKLLGAGEE
jgi:hypothetical protein